MFQRLQRKKEEFEEIGTEPANGRTGETAISGANRR
jgi:hypothetical protein